MKKVIVAFFPLLVLMAYHQVAFGQMCIGTPISSFTVTDIVDVSCFGGSDGEIEVTLVGGASPFTYSLVIETGGGDIPIASVSNTNDQVVRFTGLANVAAFGQYKVSVLTTNGGPPTFCKRREISGIDIAEPPELVATLNSVTASCGATSGEIQLDVTGGTSPYLYTWTGPTAIPNTIEDPTNLAPGTYDVVVTDANGCTDDVLGIVVPDPLTDAALSGTAAICVGGTTNLMVTLTGGSAPYIIEIDNGVGVINNYNSGDPIPVTPGTTTTYALVSATDANGCAAQNLSGGATITVNPLPTAVVSGGGTVCASDPLPSVTFTFTGIGPFDFSYSIDGGAPIVETGVASPFVINNAAAGAYEVESLSDANTCIGTNLGGTVDVIVNPLPTATVTGGGTACADNLPDVTFTFTGTGPFDFTYSIDGVVQPAVTGEPTPYVITDAGGGTYKAESLSDANTCIGTNLGGTVDVIVNPLPTAVVSGGGIVCAGDPLPDVTFTFTGTGPFDFSYSINGGAPILETGVASPFTISNAAAGSYKVESLNDANCTGTDLGGTVDVIVNPLPTAVVSGGGIACEDDLPDVTFTFTGTGPFDFSYSVDGGAPIPVTGVASPFVLTDATAGAYKVESLSDANCAGTDLGVTVNVIVNPLPTAVVSGGGIVCAGEPLPDVTFTFTGTGPFDFSYSIDGGAPTVQTGVASPFVINNAAAGTYKVESLSDANCTGTDLGGMVNVIVNPLPTAVVSGGGIACEDDLPDVTFTFTGTGPFDFSYSIDGGAPIPVTGVASPFVLTDATAGAYTVESLSDVNCTGTDLGGTVNVIVNPLPTAVVSGGGIVCADALPDVTFTFTGTGPFDFSYSIDGGAPIIQTGVASPFVINNATAGTYKVESLNDANCTGTDLGGTVDVIVNPLPTAVVSGGGIVCEDDLPDVTFTFTGTGPFDFSYSIDGGAPIPVTGVASPFVLTDATAGAYKVESLSDANCTGTDLGGTVDVIVNPLPTAVVSGGGIACENNLPDVTFTFTGTGPFDFTYSIDGVVQPAVTGVPSPYVITDAAAGTYEVETLTDANTCTGTNLGGTVDVIVNPLPTAVVSGGGIVCASDPLPSVTFTFTGTGPFDFSYSIDGGAPIVETGVASPFVINNAAAGAYEVESLSDANTCIGTNLGGTVDVIVNPLPTATVTGGGTACADNLPDVTFAFTGTGPFDFTYSIDGVVQPAVTGEPTPYVITDAGAGTYKVESLSDANTCIGTNLGGTVDVIVNPLPTAVVSGGGTVCASDPLPDVTFTFTGTGPFDFTYSIDGVVQPAVTGEPTPYVINNAGAGTYKVESLSDANCTGTDLGGTVDVIVNPLPTAIVTGGGTACADNLPDVTFTFTGTGPFDFTYSIDGVVQPAVTGEPTPYVITDAGAGTYKVESLSDANTCIGTNLGGTVDVIVNPLPTAVVSGGGTVCAGDPLPDVTFTFTGTGPFDFSYSIDGGVPIVETGVASPFVINNAAAGTYEVESLTDAKCTATDFGTPVSVVVSPLPTASITGGGPVCADQPLPDVTFSFTGSPNFDFSYSDGTTTFTVNGHTSLSFTVNEAPVGTYSVISLTDANGCAATDLGTPVDVLINSVPPDPANPFNNSYCAGDVIPALAVDDPGAGLDINWYDDEVAGNLVASGFSFTPAVAGTYYAEAINTTTGCVSANRIAATLTENPKATATLSGTTTICDGEAATLTIALTGTGPWDIVYNDGGTDITINNIIADPHTIVVNPSVTTAYSLVSVSDAVCGSGTVNGDATITVNPIVGDETTSGNESWIGYVYDDAAITTPPFSNIDFSTSRYRGFIDETDIPALGVSTYDLATDEFDLNLSNVFAISGPNICGTYTDNFSVRYKMDKTFADGVYTFTISSDEGVRFFVDGNLEIDNFDGHTFETDDVMLCLSAGLHELVIEYFDISNFSRLSFSYESATAPSVTSPVDVCLDTTAPTLSATSPGVTDFNWYSGTTLLATGPDFTPSSTDLDLSTIGSTTFTARAVYACGEGPGADIVVDVIDCTPVGTGECATVVIIPKSTPAQCTLSNGGVNISIKPFFPVVNNVGVQISIQGVSSTNLAISQTIYNDSVFANLPVGIYHYTIVYGDSSCMKTGDVTVDQSGTVGTPVVSNIIPPECFGAATGSVVLDVPGETGNALEWSLDAGLTDPFKPFTAGSQISGIPAGPKPTFARVISVRRNSSDPCYASVTFVMQDSNPKIKASFNITPASCENNDGAITGITSTGGTGGYEYSINGGQSFQTSSDFMGLSRGTYTLTTRDDSGCQSDTVATITFPGLIPVQVNKSNADCSNNGLSGAISIAISDPGTYRVALSTDQFNEPPDEDFLSYSNPFVTFGNLSVGEYYVYVRSNTAACPTRTDMIDITGPSPVSFSLMPQCSGNDLSVSLIGLSGDANSPFEIRIYEALTDNVFATIPFSALPATGNIRLDHDDHSFLQTPGDYEIQIVQHNVLLDCDIHSSLHDFVTPTPLAIDVGPTEQSYPDIANGSMEVLNIVGGFVPYSIRVDLDSASSPSLPSFTTNFEEVVANGNQQYGKVYSAIPPGRYVIEVVDSMGCIISEIVLVPMDENLFIPNIFTPNEDGTNDSFYIRNLPVETGQVKLVITNRWGKVVYRSDNYQNDWKGAGAADGVYFYQLQIAGSSPRTGWVEVLRGQSP